MSMKLIATTTVGSGGAANIEFTSIPGTHTDLVLLCSLRSARAGEVDDPITIDINGGGTAITKRELRGNGATASSASSGVDLWYTAAASTTASTFDNAIIYIPNYAGATNKSFSVDGVSENNDTTAFQHICSGLWSVTDAITSIKVKSRTTNNLVQHSVISLYGITKGSDGIVTTS